MNTILISIVSFVTLFYGVASSTLPKPIANFPVLPVSNRATSCSFRWESSLDFAQHEFPYYTYSCDCDDGTRALTDFHSFFNNADCLQTCLWNHYYRMFEASPNGTLYKNGQPCKKAQLQAGHPSNPNSSYVNQCCSMCGGHWRNSDRYIFYDDPKEERIPFCDGSATKCSAAAEYSDYWRASTGHSAMSVGCKCGTSGLFMTSILVFVDDQMSSCFRDCVEYTIGFLPECGLLHFYLSQEGARCCNSCGGEINPALTLPVVGAQRTCVTSARFSPDPAPVCTISISAGFEFYNVPDLLVTYSFEKYRSTYINFASVFVDKKILGCFYACASQLEGSKCQRQGEYGVVKDMKPFNNCCTVCGGRLKTRQVKYRGKGVGKGKFEKTVCMPVISSISPSPVPSAVPLPELPDRYVFKEDKVPEGNADVAGTMMELVTKEDYLNVVGKVLDLEVNTSIEQLPEKSDAVTLISAKNLFFNFGRANGPGRTSRIISWCNPWRCAVKVTVTSPTRIRKNIINRALGLLRTRDSFGDVFQSEKKSFVVRKQNKGKKYTVVIKYKASYLEHV